MVMIIFGGELHPFKMSVYDDRAKYNWICLEVGDEGSRGGLLFMNCNSFL